jgi:hypothetical protein
MAQIVQLPSVPNTSLSRLGDVLLGTAAEYAANRRQDSREAHLRQQQLDDRAVARTDRLADIEDERAFQRGERQAIRSERLVDDRAREEMAVKNELVRLGYLKPTQLDNPEALAAALDIVRQNGIAQRYAAAIQTGDLTYADLGDAAKVEAGLAKFAQRLASQTSFQEDQRTRAGDSQNALAVAEAQLIQQANALDAELSQPPPQPSRQEVEQLAVQMVRASGQAVNDQTLAAALPEAADKLREQLLVAWSQAKQQKLIQRQLLEARLRDNAARQNTNTNRFGVVGLVDPEATATVAPQSAPAGRTASLADAQQAFAESIARRTSAPAAPAQPPPTATPLAAPSPPAAPPQMFQAEPSASRAQTQARLNDRIGDTMRAAGYGIANVLRPSSWQGDMNAAFYELDPQVEAQQLRTRLAGMADKTAPAAVELRNRLFELDRSLSQLGTAESSATLSAPVSDAVSTPPRRPTAGLSWWGASPRFVE